MGMTCERVIFEIVWEATYQSGERQAVTETCHGSLEVAGLKVLIDCLVFHCSVHIGPYEGDCAPWDAPALIRDLDGDVFLSLDDDDLYRREIVFIVVAVTFDDGSQRVLEELETNVGQVTRNIRKCEVLWADELDGRPPEHGVVLFADKAGIFNGFVNNVVHVL
jgi:hypothetical protein